MDRRICCRCTAARAAASSRGTPTSTSRCKTGSQPYLAVGFCRRRLFGPDLVTRFTKKSFGVAGATVSTRTRPCRQRPFKFFLFLKKKHQKRHFLTRRTVAPCCVGGSLSGEKGKKIKRGDVLTSARCGVRSNQATGGSGVGRNRFNPHDDVDGSAGWSASAHQTSSFY